MCSNVNISNDSKPEMQYLPPLAPIPVIDGPTRKRALERLENNNKGALLEPAAKRQAKSVDVSYRLVVHPAKLGRIIGKNGSHIKQLREETGAAVSIPDALTAVEDRVVFISSKEETVQKPSAAEHALLRATTILFDISGEISQIQKALELIAAKLRENPAKEISSAQPGFILDAKQQMLLSQTALAGYEAASGYVSNPMGFQGVHIYGGVPLQTDVPCLPKVTAEMSIPSVMMGGIIGRGGANITQIRTISGCAIKALDALMSLKQERWT